MEMTGQEFYAGSLWTFMKLSGFAVWVVVTSSKLIVMAGWIIAPVVHLIRDALHINPVSAGVIITTHALFTALSYPLFQNMIKKMGTKKPLAFGLLLFGAAGGWGLTIDSFWLLLVSRALLGIGYAAALASINVILDLYEREEINQMMGVQGGAFGSVNWPIIGGFLGMFSWHWPFAVYVLAIPLGILAATSVPDIKKDIKKENTVQDQHVTSDLVWKEFQTGTIFSISGLIILSNILLFAILVFLPQLLDTMGIPYPFLICFFFIAIMISTSATFSLYEKMRKQISCITIILLALVLWTAGFTAIYRADSGVIVAASMILFGTGHGLIGSTISAWVDDTVPVMQKRISSYLRIFRYVARFLAPIIFLPVVSYGFGEVFLAAGGICAIVFFFVLFRSLAIR